MIWTLLTNIEHWAKKNTEGRHGVTTFIVAAPQWPNGEDREVLTCRKPENPNQMHCDGQLSTGSVEAGVLGGGWCLQTVTLAIKTKGTKLDEATMISVCPAQAPHDDTTQRTTRRLDCTWESAADFTLGPRSVRLDGAPFAAAAGRTSGLILSRWNKWPLWTSHSDFNQRELENTRKRVDTFQ